MALLLYCEAVGRPLPHLGRRNNERGSALPSALQQRTRRVSTRLKRNWVRGASRLTSGQESASPLRGRPRGKRRSGIPSASLYNTTRAPLLGHRFARGIRAFRASPRRYFRGGAVSAPQSFENESFVVSRLPKQLDF